MAQGRQISRRVGSSEKIAACSDLAFRVWAATYPFVDKLGMLPFGRHDLADCGFNRMLARGRITADDIAAGRDELVGVGLWRKRIDVEGLELIEVVGFFENQASNFRPDRETFVHKGTFPEDSAPTPGALPEYSPSREVNSREEKGRERAHARVATSVPEPAPEGTDSASNGTTSREEIPSTERAELVFLRPRVIEAFRSVHPRGRKYVPTPYDLAAIERAASALHDETDLPEVLRKGLASLSPRSRPSLENAIQALNDPGVLSPPGGGGDRATQGSACVESASLEERRREFEVASVPPSPEERARVSSLVAGVREKLGAKIGNGGVEPPRVRPGPGQVQEATPEERERRRVEQLAALEAMKQAGGAP